MSFCPTNDFKDCKFYHLRCGDIDKELGDKLIGDKRLWRKQGCLLRNPFTMTLFVNSPMRRSSSLRPWVNLLVFFSGEHCCYGVTRDEQNFQMQQCTSTEDTSLRRSWCLQRPWVEKYLVGSATRMLLWFNNEFHLSPVRLPFVLVLCTCLCIVYCVCLCICIN